MLPMMESTFNFALCVNVLILIAVTSSAVSAEEKTTIRVTTLLQAPYATLKPTASSTPKNDDFEGYIPDLLENLAKRLGIEYQLHVVADKKYGAHTDGKWTGMVGELVSGTADLAAAALTVSDNRSGVIDFTKPFQTFNTALVMKKPSTPSSSSSSPSSTEAPLPEIKSIRDLAKQNVISYGVMRDGTTAEFFRNSNDEDYKRMWDAMSTDDRNVANATEGIRRVRNKYQNRPYAFILEESMAEYEISRPPCDLISIRGQLEKRSYALATKKGSPLKDRLNTALDDMTAKDELKALHQKWFAEKTECGAAGRGTTATVMSLLVVLLPAVLIAAFVVA